MSGYRWAQMANTKHLTLNISILTILTYAENHLARKKRDLGASEGTTNVWGFFLFLSTPPAFWQARQKNKNILFSYPAVQFSFYYNITQFALVKTFFSTSSDKLEEKGLRFFRSLRSITLQALFGKQLCLWIHGKLRWISLQIHPYLVIQ